MAIRALYPVDVVLAGGACEGCIHLLHIEPAMGHLRVTGFARSSRVLIVAAVAGEAAQPFMHAHRGAIVAGANLRAPLVCGRCGPRFQTTGSMALVAERRSWIRAHGDYARAIVQLRKGERCGGNVRAFSAVEEGQ